MAFDFVGHYSHEFDALYSQDDDCTVLAGPSPSHLPLSLAQPIGHGASSAVFDPPSGSEIRLISSYITPFTSYGAADPPEPFGSATTKDPEDAWSTSADGDEFQNPDGQVLEQDLTAIPHTPLSWTAKRPRRQNRSCDPCRAAKRACDLPPRVAIQDNKPLFTACSMCKLRGAECTVAWLASRQTSRPARNRAGPGSCSSSNVKTSKGSSSPVSVKLTRDEVCVVDTLASVAASEQELARQMVLRETCSQRLYLYIDMVDSPLVKSLSQDCIPPCYSSGIKALAVLSSNRHLAPLLDHVQSRINDCWQINITSWASQSPAPRLFLAVSLLDALLQPSDSTPGYVSRDTAIMETCKWVAMATAAQLAFQKQDPAGTGAACPQAWDLAFATWQKAKRMMFENIAAIKSFRLALSLLLFGAILPPRAADQASVFEEDAVYAQREGIQRLQGLCAGARAYFLRSDEARDAASPASAPTRVVDALPSDVRDQILEVIGGLEWLVAMVHSPAVVTSRKHIPITSPLLSSNEVAESIIARARTDSHSVTAIWDHGISEDSMARVVSQVGSISVLMWRALALLTLAIETLETDEVDYEELHRLYTAMTTLINVWRSRFGQIDETTATSLQRSRPDILRSVYFCSTDVDLAILLFYDLIQSLKTQLATQTSSSTPAKQRLRCALQAGNADHKDQRLTSAMQISYLALASQGISSPGLQDKSGLKVIIQDIGAHPYPALAVQAHQLAAKALADEIQSSIQQMDTKRITRLTVGLESCMQGLQRQQQALVMFPGTCIAP